MLNEDNSTIEDDELDALLKRVDVPQTLKDSLLQIPDACVPIELSVDANDTVNRTPSFELVLATIATLAASVLIYASLTIAPGIDTDTETGNEVAVAAAENGSELLLQMKANVDSINRILASLEAQKGGSRSLSVNVQPIIDDDAIATALSLSWQSALERGASLESVKGELQFVVDQYPNTSGAVLAQNLMLIN